MPRAGLGSRRREAFQRVRTARDHDLLVGVDDGDIRRVGLGRHLLHHTAHLGHAQAEYGGHAVPAGIGVTHQLATPAHGREGFGEGQGPRGDGGGERPGGVPGHGVGRDAFAIEGAGRGHSGDAERDLHGDGRSQRLRAVLAGRAGQEVLGFGEGLGDGRVARQVVQHPGALGALAGVEEGDLHAGSHGSVTSCGPSGVRAMTGPLVRDHSTRLTPPREVSSWQSTRPGNVAKTSTRRVASA
ncbi:hypothetical protein SAMN05421869_110185 [Nonomuraea jiangxiensis]|uniref:Uncharacterized protein n=1 Tax=Nonomuraea jiangxiensis TaxID=633440 RepID=A0A1G8THL3_9ACTN|nr:hypothetical protein SAMN05421869_110185 [Nonomuraea jiangxiensis]